MMGHFEKRRKLSPIEWAKLWHAKLAGFHKVPEKRRWVYGCQHVIDFLIQQKRAGAPAWKRLKIAEALALYKAEFLNGQGESLDDICDKLRKLAARERDADEDVPARDLVGKIDPSEPPVLQQMRRVMRLNKLAFNTETAYVGKLRGFFTGLAPPLTSTECSAVFRPACGVRGEMVPASISLCLPDGKV